MAGLPGGTFAMGETHRTVTVESFCMDLTEVTADAYAACVRAGQCNDDHVGPDKSAIGHTGMCNGATYKQPGKGRHPINCVDLTQAADFCASQCKRLPTEEEWEWAARGGPRGTHYPWGNDEPDPDYACFVGHPLMVLNHNPTPTGPNPEETCAVGSFSRGDTPSGIHDLGGNVQEWTTGKDKHGDPVVRGGNWQTIAAELGASSQGSIGTSGAYSDDTGFRCVRDVLSGDGGACVPPPPRFGPDAGADGGSSVTASAVEASAGYPARDK
jgi:formylglycine-generating enzyme required for sulfatase activity